MMCESGFEDIVIEAWLCASGSIEQVVSVWKHYDRAMRVHHRMMLLSFDGNGNLTSEESRHLVFVLASDTTSSNLLSAAQSESCQRYLHQLELFKSDIRQGKLGKTAQFWMMNYCHCVWTLLRFHRAVKENNLDLFLTSMRMMLFSSDHYACYLPVYITLNWKTGWSLSQMCNCYSESVASVLQRQLCQNAVFQWTRPSSRQSTDPLKHLVALLASVEIPVHITLATNEPSMWRQPWMTWWTTVWMPTKEQQKLRSGEVKWKWIVWLTPSATSSTHFHAAKTPSAVVLPVVRPACIWEWGSRGWFVSVCRSWRESSKWYHPDTDRWTLS